MHGCMGGSIGPSHTAFEDPFVFIMHSNVDRIWALWQTQPGKEYRLDPALTYGNQTNDPAILEGLQPWAGNPPTDFCPVSPTCPSPPSPPCACPIPPWDPADPNNEVTVKNSRDPSLVRPSRYDTNFTAP